MTPQRPKRAGAGGRDAREPETGRLEDPIDVDGAHRPGRLSVGCQVGEEGLRVVALHLARKGTLYVGVLDWIVSLPLRHMDKPVKEPAFGIDGGASPVDIGVVKRRRHRVVGSIRHARGQIEHVVVGVDVEAAESALVEIDLQEAPRRTAFEPVREVTRAVDHRRAVNAQQ